MKFKPPDGKAQGRDFETSRQARLEALPESTLTPRNYPSPLSRSKGSRSCVYCRQFLTQADDAQRIDRRTHAHTFCAWRVNDAFFAELDAIEALNAEKPALVTPAFT